MNLQPPKGTRDLKPEEMIIRNKIISILKKNFENYCFNPLETPILERLELLTAKYDPNNDVIKEIYKLKDQGGRELGLRFELTIGTARFLGNNQVKLPFKRYSIGKVFRDGPIKLGRYREFIQCDIDIFGVSNEKAELELMLLIKDILSDLKIDDNVIIKFNDRELLNQLILLSGIPKDLINETIISIDKIGKLSEEDIKKELEKKGLSTESINNLFSIFLLRKKIMEENKEKNNINKLLLNKIKELFIKKNVLNEKLTNTFYYLEFLIDYFDKKKFNNFIFEPSLARGLSYYTGFIFEGFLKKGPINSSILGGGRYDDLIKLLSEKEIPAIGFSFGLEPLTDYFLKQNNIKKTVTELFIIPLSNDFQKILDITSFFRKNGINTEIDLLNRKLRKNLEYANSMNIPYVIIIGEKELSKNQFTIKRLSDGKEIKGKIEFLKEEIIKNKDKEN